MVQEAWFPKLCDALAVLWEELHASKHKDGPKLSFSPEAVRDSLRAADPAWKDASFEERESFAAAHGGKKLDEVMRLAFDPHASAVSEASRFHAQAELVAWDVRYLHHPAVQAVLRLASLANDQQLLRAMGEALSRNERYAGRGVRSQRLVTRLLHEFSFGDPSVYDDAAYVAKVRDGLRAAYTTAGVPTDDPAWKVLDDPVYFRTFIKRLFATT